MSALLTNTPAFTDLFAPNRNLKVVGAANWFLALYWENSFENWVFPESSVYSLFLHICRVLCHTSSACWSHLWPVVASSVFCFPLSFETTSSIGHPWPSSWLPSKTPPLSRWKEEGSLNCSLFHVLCAQFISSLVARFLHLAFQTFTYLFKAPLLLHASPQPVSSKLPPVGASPATPPALPSLTDLPFLAAFSTPPAPCTPV